MQPEVVAFMAAVVLAVYKIIDLAIVWYRNQEECDNE
jgi:hypothetical protein